MTRGKLNNTKTLITFLRKDNFIKTKSITITWYKRDLTNLTNSVQQGFVSFTDGSKIGNQAGVGVFSVKGLSI